MLTSEPGERGPTSDENASSTGHSDAGVSESGSERDSAQKEQQKDEEAVAGPLRASKSNGEWELRYYRIEKKTRRREGGPEMTVVFWAWYEDKKCTKRVGHIPLLAIRGVSPVPDNISDFVVRYEDAQKYAHDLLLQ